MTAEEVAALVEREVGAEWDLRNLHGITPREGLVTPERIAAVDAGTEKDIDIWVVLREVPRGGGWGVAYNEGSGRFGLVQFTKDYAPCYIGDRGRFLDAFSAM
jgi:hypothetical protein